MSADKNGSELLIGQLRWFTAATLTGRITHEAADRIEELERELASARTAATERMAGRDMDAPEQPCRGCGKPLLIENAWMEDGCPCNTPAGVNNLNLYRWRLLHELQQRQNHAASRKRNFIDARIAWIEMRARQGLLPATRDELAAYADGFADASVPTVASADADRDAIIALMEQIGADWKENGDFLKSHATDYLVQSIRGMKSAASTGGQR